MYEQQTLIQFTETESVAACVFRGVSLRQKIWGNEQ